jgi:hypothetical protein
LFYLKKVLALLVEFNALAFSLTVCERSVAQDGRTMDFYLRMTGFMKNIKRRVQGLSQSVKAAIGSM